MTNAEVRHRILSKDGKPVDGVLSLYQLCLRHALCMPNYYQHWRGMLFGVSRLEESYGQLN